MAKGKEAYLRFVDGIRLSSLQAIHAKCFDCMGRYVDGVMDCGVLGCPLHPYMPYNPRKEKRVLNLTEEQRQARIDRAKRGKP